MAQENPKLSIDIPGDALNRVRAGHSLVAHLEPDPVIETFDEQQPPYETAIALPYVVRRGNIVWGFSGPSILSHSHGKGIYGLNAFGFTNAGPFYAILSYTGTMDALSDRTVAVRLIPIATFRAFHFSTADRLAPLWSSKQGKGSAAVREAVSSGRSLSATIEIEDDVALTAPVAAAYCRLNSDGFEVRTHTELFPAFALSCDTLLGEIAARNPGMLDITVRTARPFHLNDSVLSTFICASSDGTFYSMADIHTARRQRYREMIVSG